MESELDLNDIIQEMHVIATIPDLYHLLVELNAVQSLLGLLGHENTDILSRRNSFFNKVLSVLVCVRLLWTWRLVYICPCMASSHLGHL